MRLSDLNEMDYQAFCLSHSTYVYLRNQAKEQTDGNIFFHEKSGVIKLTFALTKELFTDLFRLSPDLFPSHGISAFSSTRDRTTAPDMQSHLPFAWRTAGMIQ